MRGLFAKMTSYFSPSDPQVNNNVAIYQNCPGLPQVAGHRGSSRNIFVTTDYNTFQEIDPDTLAPLGTVSQSQVLHRDLKGPLSSAHFQRDPETGDMFNYNLAPGRTSTYRIFRVNTSTGTTDILATILEPDPPPPPQCVQDENNKWRCDLCLDYIGFETTDIMTGLYYDVILDRNGAGTKFWRFRMPLDGQAPKAVHGAAAYEVLSILNPHAGELPTINPAYACKPYRYVFGTCNRGLNTVADALVKTDLQTGDALIWCGLHGHSPGEAIFVARPGTVDEDDGIVLSIVLDGSAQKSYLLCLDARSMTESGRAEADFPIGIGFHGFHGGVVE
ncbi:hypothetical protein LMH87_010845 [Akanthomyces muscarius]|uniref:Uncharacterized protein n=1 Tax=Akanthomyces muscarius TaxID=2231603 RepID=A0A9W8UK64_AKAMU|nr:hypothetical protein LMH87_010845 [Akanthomyces muscarius]KAJ4150079.1 hypothetical protein LMH87_010845 [Akanthomyces muscarius]